MEAQILNREFQTQCIIDGFESFIWTDRYNEPGDFELYLPVERAPLEYIKEGWYVWIEESDRLAIIEDITISTDAEEGPHITFNGRTLESILDRRVVYYRTVINGGLQSGIQRLLNTNAISPFDSERRIPGLRFIWNDDPRIAELKMQGDYLGEDLLSIVQDTCVLNDLGFKILFNEKDETFDFSLFFGDDRSYNQEDLPWIVFSNRYDNLLGSSYYESKKNLRTAAVIAGSDSDEYGQEVVDVNGKPSITGLDRREMFIDGSSIERPEVSVNEESIRERLEKRKKSEEEIQQAIDEANAQAEDRSRDYFRMLLEQKGLEELSKTYITEAFEGTIEASIQYVYGRDFFIGDVVQVHDQYGKEAASRITEVVRAHDVNGETLTPTFTTLIGGSNKGEITDVD